MGGGIVQFNRMFSGHPAVPANHRFLISPHSNAQILTHKR